MGDANDLLLDGFGRIAESVPDLLDGLDSDDLAWRPQGSGNSIGWLVWHLTRVIDSHLADAFDTEQVHTAQGYVERLGLDVPASDTGYGHDSARVDQVRFTDPAVLVAYHRATQEAALEQLREVSGLDRVIDERWDPPVSLGSRLVSVLDDSTRHCGQAEYVRGLLESRG